MGSGGVFRWSRCSHVGVGTEQDVLEHRPLTNLVNGHEIHDNLDFQNRKPKSKRARARTNWTAAIDNTKGNIQGESIDVVDNNNNSNDEFIRDFEAQIEGSDNSVKEQSPIQSVDDVGLDYWRRNGRVRVSESRDDGGAPETSGDRNFGSGSERGRNWSNGFLDDGVRNWLVGFGSERCRGGIGVGAGEPFGRSGGHCGRDRIIEGGRETQRWCLGFCTESGVRWGEGGVETNLKRITVGL